MPPMHSEILLISICIEFFLTEIPRPGRAEKASIESELTARG